MQTAPTQQNATAGSPMGWDAIAIPWAAGQKAVDDSNQLMRMNMRNAQKVVDDVQAMASSQIASAQLAGQDATTLVTHQLQNGAALEAAWQKFWSGQGVHLWLASQQLGKVYANPATWWASAAGPAYLWGGY